MALRFKSVPAITYHQLYRCLSTSGTLNSNVEHHKFAVVGGGAGGLSIASYLARKFPNQVAVIEPADVSFRLGTLSGLIFFHG